MGFHPHNPANEEEQEFLVTPGDAPKLKAIGIFHDALHKFSQLQEASDKLHKLVTISCGQRILSRRCSIKTKTYRRIFEVNMME